MKVSEIQQTILSILKARMHGGNTQANFPSESIIIDIIKEAEFLFSQENSLLQLHGNFTVVGDIHGNIDDLLRIFEKRGYPPKTNYLFLGDYVDRGLHSPEVIILLLSLKVLFPTSLYMIRGNHECESVTTVYGFKKDCINRFPSGRSILRENIVYKTFMDCFMYLSYAAVINDRYFCVHGGIGPYLQSLDNIDELEKPMLSSYSDIASDLVWSDPLESCRGFTPSDRGTGFFFNNEKLDEFLSSNGLKTMIRSHESCMTGIDYPLDNCVTVFSNTDYCGMGNQAAVVIIEMESDDSQPSSPSEDSVNTNLVLSTQNSFQKENSFCTLKTEKFDPLPDDELEKRKIFIPEWLFTDIPQPKPVEKKEAMLLSPKELLDALSTPINLF